MTVAIKTTNPTNVAARPQRLEYGVLSGSVLPARACRDAVTIAPQHNGTMKVIAAVMIVIAAYCATGQRVAIKSWIIGQFPFKIFPQDRHPKARLSSHRSLLLQCGHLPYPCFIRLFIWCFALRVLFSMRHKRQNWQPSEPHVHFGLGVICQPLSK